MIHKGLLGLAEKLATELISDANQIDCAARRRFRSFSVGDYYAEMFLWTFFEKAEKSEYCLISVWRNSATKGANRVPADLQLIVFFDKAPFEAKQPRRERKQLRNEWGFRHSSLCIDKRTELAILVKQLAICFKRANLVDHGIENCLFSGDSNVKRRTRRFVYDNLIANFVNPEHPGDFGAARRMWFILANKEFAASRKGGEAEADDGIMAAQGRRHHAREKKPDQDDERRRDDGYQDFVSVHEAAVMFGVPKRTVYRVISTFDAERDSHNRIRLTGSDVQKLKEIARRHVERRVLTKFKSALAKVTGVKRHNVRIRVNRMRARGRGLEEIAKRIVPPEAWDRFRELLGFERGEREVPNDSDQ